MNLEELGKLKHDDKQFTAVLEFVSQVQNAKTAKSDTSFAHVVGISDLREDIVKPSLPRTVALSNAKNHDGTYFVVPQVVE